MTLLGKIKRLWGQILGAIFPRRCIICAREGRVLCTECEGKWQPATPKYRDRGPTLDGVVSLYYYADPIVRGCLHEWKFRGDGEAGARTQALFAARFQVVRAFARNKNIQTVVWAPLHFRRKFTRGFDQAEELARTLAHGCDLVALPLLERARATKSQATLDNHGRHAAMADSPFAVDDAFVVPERVILVDDVFTSGATATACAVTLKAAGVKEVYVVTLAAGGKK